MQKPFLLTPLLAAAALALAGCAAVGPDYRAPMAQVESQWSAPLPHGGSLQQLNTWWQQFNDPTLLALQQAAESDSPTLAVAWGNIELARATVDSARAGGSPAVNANASATRSRQLGTGTTTMRTGGFDGSWELDLLGKVRRNVEAADAQLQGRRDDWHDARVSLAAEAATYYVQYRACGQFADAYEQEAASMAETARATESLVRAGLSPGNDAALAQATQASTASALIAQRAQCDVLVKSLVQLTGLSEARLRALLDAGGSALPDAPGLAVEAGPALVVQQRPDVAARERDLAAASASIGVATAQLYPSLSISGSIGLTASGGASLTTWSLGPSLSLPLFDGGARQAGVASARASYEIAYAQWRDAVRGATAEVEKALVQLDETSRRAQQAERATLAYRRYLEGAQAELRAGTISLLTYEEARRQALNAQLEWIGLQRDRVVYWIALYKAVGGGWQAGDAAAITPPASRP